MFRSDAWLERARSASATPAFASQTDLAALFVERLVDLLAPGGVMGLLLPSKLWSSLAGGGARCHQTRTAGLRAPGARSSDGATRARLAGGPSSVSRVRALRRHA